MSRWMVKQVAVLGAGVMGAQIAAHLVNCRIPVRLFDLDRPDEGPGAIARQAIERLKKLKPAPLGVAADAELIQPADYAHDLERLRDCDLVIEAIAERLDWKAALYQQLAPVLGPNALLVSNTSGLSMADLSQALPEALQPRFCGVHFFNPPRYMPLVELIPAPATPPEVLDRLEGWLTSALGKGVVRARDTPNFMANRLGVAGLLATLHEAERHGLTADVVDDLTGKRLGRAASGTFRTADVVGLDTLAHVIGTLERSLSPATDPFHALYAVPPVLRTLIERGHLGQKSGAGFFRKQGRALQRFDAGLGDYVPCGPDGRAQKADEVYGRMLKRPAAERLRLLQSAEGAQGRFVWAVLRNSFHYAAVHLADIADTAREVDLAMRWGFGMQQGPFELWQEAGWLEVARMVQADIDAGLALCSVPLPDWVWQGSVAERGGVHQPEGSWSPTQGRFVPRAALAVRERQCLPEALFGEGAPTAMTAGRTVREWPELRLWTLDGQVLIATLKTKMHVLGPGAVAALREAVALAEAEYDGLVIGSGAEVFSAGADLQAVLPAFMARGVAAVDEAEQAMQQLMLALRYAQVPIVAAMRGLALGGGCELALHCSRRVAHQESYIGLVEAGVGLVPGAGGLTWMARRAAERAAHASVPDLLPALSEAFRTVAMATVGTSAQDSRRLGYLLPDDLIVPHRDELLWVAIEEVKQLRRSGYRPPWARPFPVAGRSAQATLLGSLVNMRDGGFITEHDFLIAREMAHVMTGGDVEAGTLVNEAYLMRLERAAFTRLVVHPKSQARMLAMLSDGKPLRN